MNRLLTTAFLAFMFGLVACSDKNPKLENKSSVRWHQSYHRFDDAFLGEYRSVSIYRQPVEIDGEQVSISLNFDSQNSLESPHELTYAVNLELEYPNRPSEKKQPLAISLNDRDSDGRVDDIDIMTRQLSTPDRTMRRDSKTEKYFIKADALLHRMSVELNLGDVWEAGPNTGDSFVGWPAESE